MKISLELRQALESDAVAIAGLIHSTSAACCFSEEQPCPDWYTASLRPERIASLIKSGSMTWLVAVQENKLVGVLAISDKSHIKYFFVDPARQRLGIGKKLWHCAMQGGKFGSSITVRSSLFAVPVYERLGFKATEPPQMFNGLHYQTMVATRDEAVE